MLNLILGFVLTLLVLIGIGGFYYRKISGVCRCTNSLKGKTVIITGATAGIGKEAAKDLASRDARVIIACRNLEKGEETKEWISESTGNKNVEVRLIDVSDLTSVRKFAAETLKKEKRIDVLINNAGAGFPEKRKSKQGFELTMATNHYGHFLLTNLLLGLIKKSAPSRIINVSSVAHKSFSLDLDDINFDRRPYGVFKAYAQSKLCNILFTKELAHRLIGKGVTVNALHPGGVATEITNKEGTVLGFILFHLSKFALKSSKLGAQTTIHLAVSDEGEHISGEYFVDCKKAATSKKALDPGLAKDLWELSEEQTGLTDEEKSI